MNTAIILQPSFSQHIAVALWHLTWLGAVIGLTAAIGNALLRRSSPASRYRLNAAALSIMLFSLPIVLTRQTLTMRADGLPPLVREASVTERGMSDRTLAESGTAPAEAGLPSHMPAAGQPALATAGDRSASRTWKAFAPWITGIYAAGVLAMVVRLLLGLCVGRRLHHAASPLFEPDILALIERQARAIGVRITPTVRSCERVAVPIVIGVVRPIIVLPLSMITALTPEQLASILTHELAHIRRLDHIAIIVQRLVEAVWYFHPALWYISRRMDREREQCCDDLVIAAGVPRHSYAGALCRVAEYAATRRALAPHTVAVAAAGRQPSQLRRRIVRLFERAPEPAVQLTRSGLLGLTALILVLCLPPILLPTIQQQAQAQPADDAKTPLATAPREDDLLRQDLKRLIGRWKRSVPRNAAGLREELTIDGQHDTLDVVDKDNNLVARYTSQIKLERTGDVRIYNRSKIELVKGSALPYLGSAETQSFIVQFTKHGFYEVTGLLHGRNGTRHRPAAAYWKSFDAPDGDDKPGNDNADEDEEPAPKEDPLAEPEGQVAERRAQEANDPELKRDLELFQGSWEIVKRDPQGNLAGTNEKVVKGNTERLIYSDAEGLVTYSHTVEFHLEKYGPVRIFHFTDFVVDGGPDAGTIIPADYSFVYRIDNDRLIDAPGLFVSRPSYRDIPQIFVWRRPQSRAEIDATLEFEKLGGSVSRVNHDDGDHTILRLSGKKFGDEHLGLLKSFKNLKELLLDESRVTDAGMKDLAKLVTLTRLDLTGADAGDAGLKELAGLTNLTNLSLGRTRITDAGLAELNMLKDLRQLSLGQTKITDRGVKVLVQFKGLVHLGIAGAGITDAGLGELSQLESLKTLVVGGPRITDASVKQLAKFKNLKELRIGKLPISEAGVQELKAALPETNVHR